MPQHPADRTGEAELRFPGLTGTRVRPRPASGLKAAGPFCWEPTCRERRTLSMCRAGSPDVCLPHPPPAVSRHLSCPPCKGPCPLQNTDPLSPGTAGARRQHPSTACKERPAGVTRVKVGPPTEKGCLPGACLPTHTQPASPLEKEVYLINTREGKHRQSLGSFSL